MEAPAIDPERLGALLDAIAAEVERAAETLAADMGDAERDVVPVLGADAAIVADVQASNRANLQRWLTVVRRHEPPTPADVPPEALDAARTIVRRGLEVDALLHAYRIGQRVAWQAWMAAAYRVVPAGPELVRVLEISLDRLFAYVDVSLDRVLEEARRAREELVDVALARRAETIRLLLEGAPVDTGLASARLGYELARRHTALVLWGPPEAPHGELERTAQLVARAAGARRPLTLPVGTTTTWAWLPADTPPSRGALASALAPDGGVRVAVGPSLPGVSGFRRSHEAALAIQRLIADRPGEERLAHHEDLAVTVLAAQDPARADEFVAATLGRLAADDPATARLRETLRVFLEEAENAPRAAARLSMHRNTVLQRVARATELLGGRPGERRLAVELALELHRRLGPPAPETAG